MRIRFPLIFILALLSLVLIPSGKGSAEQSSPYRDAGAPAQASGGEVVASLPSYRLDNDSFSFENYGGETKATNLTSEDMRRLFGDGVCTNLKGGTCHLTPVATEWMREINKAMDGGHCEGLAALSLVFFTQKLKASDFGADKPFALKLQDNTKLQREIAYWWATQIIPPVKSATAQVSPSELLDVLASGWARGETFTLGFFKRDMTGGHAVTPYAIRDMGNGIFAIAIYEDNYPGTDRAITVDRNKNTWSYTATTNPNEPGSLYEGDADTKTIQATPTQARFEPFACPFCESNTAGSAGRLAGVGPEAVSAVPAGFPAGSAPALAEPKFNQIFLDGDGQLLITDDQGRRTGYVDGKLIREIPGVQLQPQESSVEFWKDDDVPIFLVPTGMKIKLTIDGTQLQQSTSTTLAMVSPGYDLEVSDIMLDPGQKDTLALSADGHDISYTSSTGEHPSIVIGDEEEKADYQFTIKGEELGPGDTVNLTLDETKGQLKVNTKGSRNAGSIALDIYREDDETEQDFSHGGIEVNPSDTIYFDYGKWNGQGSVVFEIDRGSDGSIDETDEISADSDGMSTVAMAGIGVGVLIVLGALGAGGYLFMRRRQQQA